MTPCDRLLALPEVAAASKAAQREQFNALDPVLLLRTIRDGQQRLAELSGHPSDEPASAPNKADVVSFLQSLPAAWENGEVRPTHRKQPGATRWWKTRADPFAHAWPMVEQWLMREPTVTAKELLVRLASIVSREVVYEVGAEFGAEA